METVTSTQQTQNPSQARALEKSKPLVVSASAERFMKRCNNGLLFRLFMLVKLPLALIARVRLVNLSAHECQVAIPFRWINQNPFRSTYFAALSMAGEMSTGLLGLTALNSVDHPISILVVDMHSNFVKKATDVTTFTCTQGADFFHAVEHTMRTGEAVTVTAHTIGRNKKGEEVCSFDVTWSLKKKSKRS